MQEMSLFNRKTGGDQVQFTLAYQEVHWRSQLSSTGSGISKDRSGIPSKGHITCKISIEVCFNKEIYIHKIKKIILDCINKTFLFRDSKTANSGKCVQYHGNFFSYEKDNSTIENRGQPRHEFRDFSKQPILSPLKKQFLTLLKTGIRKNTPKVTTGCTRTSAKWIISSHLAPFLTKIDLIINIPFCSWWLDGEGKKPLFRGH